MDFLALYSPIWRKALILSWPVMFSHVFSTAMRTTDMLLMGGFGPAAVTAVGLGDVWDRIVLQLGLGLGTGSIALISQETGGSGAEGERDAGDVVTQVLVTGFAVGLPFILVGHLMAQTMIAILGAGADVIHLAAQYLQIIFSAAPFRIVNLIAAKAIQGTGDTRTPMAIGITGNAVNIGLSVGLVWGVGPLPALGVPGVGWGTALANFLMTVMYVAVLSHPATRLTLRMPPGGWDLTITRQLLRVSIPRILQGGYQVLISFPFNAVVLLFGTEAAAAFHVSRRIQQQLIAPMQRSYATVSTILVGQALGRDAEAESRRTGSAMLWLSALTIGAVGLLLFLLAPQVVRPFSADPTTVAHSIRFLRALSLGAPILASFMILSGLLAGAGDTRTAFYASVASQTLLMLGLSYAMSVVLGLGVTGVVIGLVADYAGRTGLVALRFASGKWVSEARDMIAERNRRNMRD